MGLQEHSLAFHRQHFLKVVLPVFFLYESLVQPPLDYADAMPQAITLSCMVGTSGALSRCKNLPNSQVM